MSKKKNTRKNNSKSSSKKKHATESIREKISPADYEEQLVEIENLIAKLPEDNEVEVKESHEYPATISEALVDSETSDADIIEEVEDSELSDTDVIEEVEDRESLDTDVIEEVEDNEISGATINEKVQEINELETKDSDVESCEVLELNNESENEDETEEIEIFNLNSDDSEDEIAETLGIVNKEEKKARRRKFFKKFMIFILSILVLLGVIYLSATYYFTTHFFYNTKVNGIQVDFLNVSKVHEILEKEVQSYEISLSIDEENDERIQGTDINLQYNQTEELDVALKKQKIWKWPVYVLEEKNIDFNLSVDMDSELLETIISEFEFTNLDEYSSPVNAYPKVVKGEVVIIEEEYGNAVADDFVELLECKISELEESFDMTTDGGYLKPEYIHDSEKVAEAKSVMEQYLDNSITYSEGDVIGSETIADWLKVNKTTLEISIDEDKVKEFVSNLAKKYNTVGTTRTFKNPDGREVTVSGGSYGWTVDQDAEKTKILENIKDGESVERSIEYSKKASSHGATDWGTTFAMIDLTNQKMWMVVNGEVVVTSDVVTGDVAGGNATPQGVSSVTYTTKNATLRGALRSDGTREYEVPVAYWMPFNGGIGFHDATWRSSFGGTIYKSNGSHGCINMPLEKAKALYGYLKAGMPVICHF